MIHFPSEKQEAKLQAIRREEEEAAAKRRAGEAGLPYVNLRTVPIDAETVVLIPEDDARAAGLAAVQRTGKELRVALADPTAEAAGRVLERLARENFTVHRFVASRASLEKAWTAYRAVRPKAKAITGRVELSHDRIQTLRNTLASFALLRGEITAVLPQKATDLLEVLLAGSLALDASDIHIEPGEAGAKVRLRLDGVLEDIVILPLGENKELTERIKLVSGIKLNVTEAPQDGRFSIEVEGTEIEIRTSTLPGEHGENVVMRVLNPNRVALELEALGLRPDLLSLLETELKAPNGMILTTGPTGSGKTTTLYACLKKIASPDVKIITIEDPIEYHLPGLEQTQIDPANQYDFADALRAVVRQDPDVILVGEIRDLETAEAALHASLTGHLVFSTLHTNDAAGTVPRLIDLGAKPPIIAPSINLAMAQRLVRRLCEQCKTPRKTTKEEERDFERLLKHLPPAVAKPDPSTPPRSAGLRSRRAHGESDRTIKKPFSIYRAKGCEACHNTGYKGRIAVYEMFRFDEEIEKIILEKSTEAALQQAALKQGMITLRDDGLLRVLEGVTTIEEVERVVGATEND